MLILASQSVMMSWYWACRFWSEASPSFVLESSTLADRPSSSSSGYQMEMAMNSVDRVDEFFRIPQEARLLIPETTPPAYWPSNSGETLVSVLASTFCLRDHPRTELKTLPFPDLGQGSRHLVRSRSSSRPPRDLFRRQTSRKGEREASTSFDAFRSFPSSLT